MTSLSYFGLFKLVLKRDLKIALRHRDDIINPLLFFIITITLFPLGIGPSPETMATIAPGVLWVAALLASLLSLDRLFKSDYQDGALEQLLLSPNPEFIWVLAKVFTHWLLTGLPLLIIAPMLAGMLSLPSEGFAPLMLTLLLGTPVLSFIGAIGAALTVGSKKGGVLISLLVLPLYIPVLIFSTSAIQFATFNLPYEHQIVIIAAMLVGAITLAPFAIVAALRISTN